MRTKLSISCRVAAATLCMAISVHVLGQSADSPRAPTSDTLAEVVVTAQRRQEDAEKTPVAVTALGPELLERKGIASEQDLQSAVPGFTIRSTTSSNQFTYSLRGQSVDSFSSSQPAVLTYFNEVQTTPLSATPFYDLESIQVLKGPQGTLFGRNATGGAVLFTSAAPVDELSGYAKVRFGDYNYQNIEGALNIPLVSDRVILRIAGDYQHRDGFFFNTVTDSRAGEQLREGGRASLLVKLSDELTNTLVVDFAHSGGENSPVSIYSVYPPGSSNNGFALNSTSSVLFSPALDTAIGLPGAWASYLASHPNAYPGGLVAFADLQKSRSPFTVSVDSPLSHRADSSTLSNVTAYQLSDNATLKNIFGVNHAFSNDNLDVDGTPFLIEGTGAGGEANESKTYSEELQFLGKSLNQQLDYVTGVYFSHQNTLYNAPFLVYDLAPTIPVTSVHNDTQTQSIVYAAYAQGTYDLSRLTSVSGLSASAGARFTTEETFLHQLPGDLYHNVPGTQNDESDAVHLPSYQVGIQEQLNSQLLLYVVARHSFRSGGFNTAAPSIPATAADGGNAFSPEKTTDVELGAKYQGVVLGIPTRLNVDVYDQRIHDIQRTIYATPPGFSLSSLTVNVPKADVRGAEIEGQISPTKWLDIGGNLSFTDAHFVSNEVGLFGSVTSFGPYADTPRWSGSVFSQATFETGIGALSFRSDVYAQSLFYFSSLANTITPDTTIPMYAVVNFRIGLDRISNTNANVSATVKNAFNRTYYTGGFAPGNVLSLNAAVPGDPRTFYVELGYKF